MSMGTGDAQLNIRQWLKQERLVAKEQKENIIYHIGFLPHDMTLQ